MSDRVTVIVQNNAFDGGQEISRFRASQKAGSIGAIASFSGTVRDLTGTLDTLHLEHYPGMTERELREIANAALKRFDLTKSLIIHRYGPMKPGEEIVLVIASAAHRHAAFDACRFMMDHLKTDAPFWKQEIDQEGSKHWVEARQSDDAAKDSWRE